MTEQIDTRVRLLNAILDVPHGDLEKFRATHQEILDTDPWFYLRLACWYEKNGEIRDHKTLFPSMLSTSRWGADNGTASNIMQLHRANGNALLKALPPYMIARSLKFITDKIGHRPRTLRGTVTEYIRLLELNEPRFDGTVLTSRDDLRYLYATLHIKPSKRAQAILFDDDPPEGSRPWAVKQAAAAETVLEKATIIAEYNLPWQVAASLVNPKHPVALAALVNAMTPAQVINNQKSIKNAGGMDHPDIRQLVKDKLKQAKTKKGVAAYKAKVAKDVSGVDAEIGAMLEDVRETQIKARGEITARTAILVDISGSQADGIKVTKQLVPMISSICTSSLYVLAFNTAVYELQVPKEEITIQFMEGAMAGLRASGGTSMGLPIEWLRRNGHVVDQFLLVTDEGENHAPSFQEAYEAYAKDMGIRPTVTIVRVGLYLTDKIQQSCQRMMVQCNAFDFRGDYYALPGVIPFLTGKTRADLVMEIMDTPLLVEV